ncbi:MAG TPA: hypothetical protein VL336_08155 [Sphingomicrobium sp.]|nr:hypothetical protein [Sphingomicrobium sp.]
MTGKFAHEPLRVLYTADALEFHATDDSQVRNEELIHSLYRPMLALFIITNPATETVAREPEWGDGFVAEMKSKVPGASDAFDGIQLWEQAGLNLDPTRLASKFPVNLLFIDGEGMATGPDGHAGLKFLQEHLDGRETVTVADIEAISAKWKQNDD